MPFQVTIQPALSLVHFFVGGGQDWIELDAVGSMYITDPWTSIPNMESQSHDRLCKVRSFCSPSLPPPWEMKFRILELVDSSSSLSRAADLRFTKSAMEAIQLLLKEPR